MLLKEIKGEIVNKFLSIVSLHRLERKLELRTNVGMKRDTCVTNVIFLEEKSGKNAKNRQE